MSIWMNYKTLVKTTCSCGNPYYHGTGLWKRFTYIMWNIRHWNH